MSETWLALSRMALVVLGMGTMAGGATVPVESFWPKLAAIMGGLVATLLGIFMTAFIKHISNHDKLLDEKRKKEIKAAVQNHQTICGLERQAHQYILFKMYKKICPEDCKEYHEIIEEARAAAINP